jgi:hypothetical protein
MSKFDYVLMHTRFIGSCKLSSFGGHRVGRSLTFPAMIYTVIVYRPPTNSPVCGITWKTCTREKCDPVRLFDRCRELWPLVVPSWLTCVMFSGFSLGRYKSIRISVKPLDMGDTCLLQSFRRSVDYLVVKDWWLLKYIDWDTLHA